MGKITVKMDNAGCVALLNSSEIQAEVLSVCDGVAASALSMAFDSFGCAYATDVRPGKTRAVGRVRASNQAAMNDNSENNTLVKALKNAKV